MLRFLPFCIALSAALTGCSLREPRATAQVMQPQANRSYVDLEPGWRIRVVTPILKSGKFLLNEQAIKIENGAFLPMPAQTLLAMKLITMLLGREMVEG